MTWDQFIGHGQEVLTLTALASATYAACEFIRSVWDVREKNRKLLVNEWRKVSVQLIVAASEPFMTAEQITSELRSKSFEAPFDIRKNELTVEAVRMLILELIRDGILGQIWPDSYGIIQIPRDVTLPMAVAGVKGSFAVRQAFALIHEHPGRYDDEELFARIGHNLGVTLPDFILAISDLDSRNVANKGPGGKWSPVLNRIEGQH
jgi:hypothetical protein